MSQDRVHPRPEQIEALTALTRAFAVHDRAQLVMACGTGKTLISRWHAQTAEAHLSVVFVPSLALLAQTLREWRRAHGWPFEALVVCSDPTTSAGEAERRGDEGHVVDVDRPQWSRLRARVTTSPAVAAGFLRRGLDRPRVVFSTYHSAPVVAAAQALSGAAFDLAVCDEAHRLAGRPREEFRIVLDRRAVVARKRLFMTATPQILDGDDVVSMDDHQTFGPVAHTVTFRAAIDAGLLADYQVVVIAGREGQRADERREPQTVPGALLDAIERYGIRRLLTFHGRVAKARRFAEVMDHSHSRRADLIVARCVHGGQAAAERTDTLGWLGEQLPAHQVRVVSNARCLTEGVDVPAVDGLLFADQRSSVIDIIQAIGRVLRPAPGKVRGTIIIPVTLPPEGDDDTALALSAFAHVWAVLRGLRAHDERLAEDLDRMVREHAPCRRSPRTQVERVEFLLPDGFDGEPVQLRLVQEVGSSWERSYLAVQDWAFSHPDKRLGRNDSHRGVGIGEWAFAQRLARSRGMLPGDRVRRLEEIPGWYWDREQADWADSYAILEAFADAFGTVVEREQGTSLFDGLRAAGGNGAHRMGVWMALQRQAYRDGMLEEDRARLLEKLPGWAWDAGLPAEHVAMVQALRVFGEFEKHADVPEEHKEDGLELGRWVLAVRRAKVLRKLPPALADEISAATPRLKGGGKGAESFHWETAETRWRLAYSALRQYTEREGHACPTHAVVERIAGTRLNLGQWVALQRHRHRRGSLDGRYAGWLQALPGWVWDAPGVRQEYGDPIDLGGWPHGTAKGIAARCPCKPCVDAHRQYDRDRLARQREPVDPVAAAATRRKIEVLEGAGVKRTAVVAASGVPLGVIRKVVSGEWGHIERVHAEALRALTVQDCQAVGGTRVGSRGRTITTANERIPAEATWEILDDLKARGFGIHWIARELGYVNGMQIGREVVSRRIADQVAALADRIGELTYPRVGNRRIPPLAQLLAEETAA